VRIAAKGMFASSSATVEQAFLPVLNRIGEAVNVEPGPLLVTGHSDNIPIRSVKFPSNWHLSVARADAVKQILAQKVKDPSRLTAEGKADNQPIAPNTTPEGREQNRRVEVVLTKAEWSDAVGPAALCAMRPDTPPARAPARPDVRSS